MLRLRGWPFSLALLACALLWSGCASDEMQVSSVHDPLRRFPASATWAWDEARSRLPDQKQLRGLDPAPLIKEVAEEEFALRGYRVVRSGRPDFRLAYQLAVYTFRGPDRSTASGTLSLFLADAESGERVWTGFARAEVLVDLTPEERRARLHEAMAAMLEGFPPSHRGGK